MQVRPPSKLHHVKHLAGTRGVAGSDHAVPGKEVEVSQRGGGATLSEQSSCGVEEGCGDGSALAVDHVQDGAVGAEVDCGGIDVGA